MAEKKDVTKLSKVELVEMLQRQEKLLRNRKFINSLPDKGDKIHKLVEKLKEQITIREQADDLATRFKRISLAKSRNATQNVGLDSDDDEFCDNENNDNTMVVDKKGASAAATQVTVQKESPSNKEETPKKQSSGKWDYDSAVTHVKPHVFEKAKVLSLEESRQLQVKQKEEYEALKAKQAAEKLFEHINKSSSQTGPSSCPSSYKFSSTEAKMKYREEEEENVQESEEDSETEDKFYEQEQSDED